MSGGQIKRDASTATGGDQKVIPFRPRTSAHTARSAVPQPGNLTDELADYEQSHEPDDYRHRMVMNVAAGLFTVALTAFGIWLAMSIADLRKTTDCLLIGRRDCAVMPEHHR
jgi:hypothetical protein